MEELIYRKTYIEFRDELKGELKKTAESFVRIGYLLKVARDTDILKTSGYAGLEDFARGEFDLDKTQVSRFIRINDRFSEEGNSDRLMTGYADFGVRKLGLMLTLPDVINEELSPGYTVEEITSIKETYDEEQKVTPIEDYIEQTEAKEENNKAARLAEADMLSAVLYQIGHDDPELFIQMFESENLMGDTDLFSVLAPGGESTHKVRIKGVGGILVTCNDKELTITNLRTLVKESIEWEKVNREFNSMLDRELGLSNADAKEAWQQVYGEEYPTKAEVAPVQPKKESKVIDHTKKEKKDADTISEKALQPERREETAGSVSERTKEEPKEEAKEEPKEEPRDKPEEITSSEGSRDGRTPEQILENIEISHEEARRIAGDINVALSQDTEDLSSEKVWKIIDLHSKLKTYLEIMRNGFDEYEEAVEH